MKHKVIGYLLAILFLVIGFIGMKKMISSKKEPERKETIATLKLVKILEAQPNNIPIQITISGKLESFNKIELFSEVGGTMLKGNKDFKEGIFFSKGEIIFQMDSRDVFAALVAQRSSFLTLLSQITPDLKLDYSANYAVWNEYIQEFDVEKSVKTLPNPLTTQEKQFLTSKNIYNSFYNIKSQELKLSKYMIVAPFDGVLNLTNIQYGTIVRPGQKLGEFIQPSKLELEAPVNIKDINYLKIGDIVNLGSNDIQGNWKGKIVRIGKSIDSKTQSVMVYIAIENEQLKEGMYLNGKINAKLVPNSIEINRKLLNEDESIYIVQNNKLEKIFPKIEKINESTVILSDIKAGTTVLSEPFTGMYNGLPVQITK